MNTATTLVFAHGRTNKSARPTDIGRADIFNSLDGKFMKRVDEILHRMDSMIALILSECPASRRLLDISGIGLLTTAGLLSALEGGEFRTDDSFVAYLGLDPRACDSGQSTGPRRLTKQGDGELRRLLFNAAMAAVRCAAEWEQIYKEHIDRGLKRTQALVAVMRKLARTAWSIHRHGTVYDPLRVRQSI